MTAKVLLTGTILTLLAACGGPEVSGVTPDVPGAGGPVDCESTFAAIAEDSPRSEPRDRVQDHKPFDDEGPLDEGSGNGGCGTNAPIQR